MDENDMLQETVEPTTVPEDEPAAMEDGPDPADSVAALWDPESEGVEDQHPAETEPTGEAGQTSEAPAGEKQEAPDGAPAEGKGTQTSETFTLNYMGQARTVSRDEVTALAQQGMDYGRVRTERDALREYKAQTEPAMTLVQTMAQRSGMTVEQYIDFCRAQELMAQGVNEPTARAQVALEKQQAAQKAQEAEAQAAQRRQEALVQKTRERTAARQRDMEAFLDAYPQVKPEAIPAEVWQAVKAGESLVTAYARYENTQLRAQLAAQEQNKQNAARTPGSMQTQGERGRKTIADLWDGAGD